MHQILVIMNILTKRGNTKFLPKSRCVKLILDKGPHATHFDLKWAQTSKIIDDGLADVRGSFDTPALY